MSDTRSLTARELIARGIEQDQFERPFAGGETPEERRAAADEVANRRRNAERWPLGHRALYERGLRALEEAAGGAESVSAASPASAERRLDRGEEVRLASESALDRRIAALWPRPSDFRLDGDDAA